MIDATPAKRVDPVVRTRGAADRARHVLLEAWLAPLGRALTAGIGVAGLGAVLGELASGTAVGAAATLVCHAQLSASARTQRQTRTAEDAVLLSPWFARDVPALGTWAVEADFAQLVMQAVRGGATRVVELGSGTTTLLIARLLEHLDTGRLISVEHDAGYAGRTLDRLCAAGLEHRVTMVVAPLAPLELREVRTAWYGYEAVLEAAADGIDLLVVDGPPSVTRSSRWAAVPALIELFRPGAVVLLDDGRARWETGAAARWSHEFPELDLYWHDTVKGTWRLNYAPSGEPDARPVRWLRTCLRTINPHPTGFGRWPVRR